MKRINALLFCTILTLLVVGLLSDAQVVRRRPMTGGCSPADKGTLKVRLRSGSITGLNDGDAVASWNDSTANGHNMAQSDASKRPQFKVSIQNGYPAVRFDGGSDYLENSTLSLGTTATVFVVGSRGSATGYIRAVSRNLYLFVGSLSGEFASFYGDGSAWGTVSSHGASGALTANTVFIFSSTIDGTNDNPFVNGTTLSTRADSMSSFSGGFYIGGDPAAGQYWDRDIIEVDIYDPALNSTDRQYVRDCLNTIYAVY